MNVVAIIPARGGSKRIPRKNVLPFDGKPLINYTIEASLNSKHIDRTIVSTDDEEIKSVSEKAGAEVADRPSEFAKDNSPTVEALLHVLNVLEKEGYNPDAVVILQPTSPLRTSEDVDAAVEKFQSSDADTLVGVRETNVYGTLEVENGFAKPVFDWKLFTSRKQDLPKSYVVNGAMYVINADYLKNTKKIFSDKMILFEMPKEKSVDIDDKEDFDLAEFYKKRVNKNE